MFALHPVRVAFIGPQQEKVKAMGNTPNLSLLTDVAEKPLSVTMQVTGREGRRDYI